MPRRNPPRGIPRRLDTNAGHYVSDVEFSPGFWEAIFAVSGGRVSRLDGLDYGNVTPDKAKDHQPQTDGLSAPHTSTNEATGVDTKYSR